MSFTMTKQLIFHHLKDENNRPAMERWNNRYHIPEVIVKQPWIVKYLLYRPVPHPEGAEDFFPINYRLHENWALDESTRRGPKGLLSMTKEPVENALDVRVVTIPAEPTEDFFGAERSIDDSTILRWVVAFSYPEGVSEEEGEDWYLNVHAKEVLKQPGLIRFFSSKAIPNSNPFRRADKQKDQGKAKRPIVRVSELWYENNNGWRNSVILDPPEYTKPDWAKKDAYPFLTPKEDFISAFILESPDCDMLREYKPMYY